MSVMGILHFYCTIFINQILVLTVLHLYCINLYHLDSEDIPYFANVGCISLSERGILNCLSLCHDKKKKIKSHKIISFFVEFELIQKDEYKMTCIKFKMR
jgi:hypothetical protein